ncbi:MAG: protein kinase [Planctomycetota bacterium]|nr:protein kinase [Planctomycetota bacterium]
MADPAIGSTLGGCEIMETIGHGGMGIIYKARQKSLDRIVALKVLSPRLANDINFVTRFQREARAIAKVNHSNILAVYDVGADNDFHYMIMELIEGESLAETQTRVGGQLKVEDACRYVRDAAQGLEAAHAGGITHRDVKPENIMLTKKGVIKVSDFGLAKEADNSSTSTDAVMGTPAFMSPEQCDGKKVDHRTDIYSLGGTFYKLLTGRLPFEAETAMSMMYRHKHEALVPPNEIVPVIPQAISEVAAKMMAKKREQRYQTMTEVIVAIDQALQAVPSSGVSGRLARGAGGFAAPAQELNVVLPPVEDAPPPDRPMLHAPTGNTSIVGGRFDPPSGIGAAMIPPPGAKTSDRLPRGGAGSSGKIAPPSFAAGASEDGFSLAARGDEMVGRGDRVGGLKQYRMALQSHNLDGATRQRLETEIQNEIRTRRQAGENLLRRGLLVEASREFRILLELDPKDEAVRSALKEIDGKLATKRTLINDIRTAIAGLQFEKAIQLWDRTPLDLRDESLGKQVEHLRTVIVPSLKLCEQGEMYNEQGRLEEALATFQDALRIDQTCERARRGVSESESKLHRIELMLKDGYEYHLKQDYSKAIETWKPILTLRPGHPQAVKSIVDAYVALAQSRRGQGDLKGALKCYQGAHEADPQNRTVGRQFEEMTELHDKEQALIDRANEATARGRSGEAIRYWKEVLRVNPANKTARQSIEKLGKVRTVGMVKVVATLLVLAIGGYCSFQFIREKQALSRASEQFGNGAFGEAVETVRNQTFLFLSQQSEAMIKDATSADLLQQAEKLETDGKLDESIVMYRKLIGAIADARQRELYNQKIVELQARGLIERGEADLARKQWKDARSAFTECQTLLRGTEDAKLQELNVRANHSLLYSSEIEQAIQSRQAGKRDEAIRHAQEAKRLRPDLGFADEELAANHFDPTLAAGKVAEARRAFGEPWKLDAVKRGREALKEAVSAGYDMKQARQLSGFAEDIQACDDLGMVLYTNYEPTNAASTYDRKESFCIDRFEYPNTQGTLPQVGVSQMEAKLKCQESGKELCDWKQWNVACMAKKNFRAFTYGENGVQGACNTDAAALAESGKFGKCYNEIGAYDMNGNAAEWTLDGDAEGWAYQGGGSFKSAFGKASCRQEDRGSAEVSKSGNQAGFRCCKKLTQTQK